MQVVANGGKTKPSLFKRAIASSTYVPPTYQYNDPQAEVCLLYYEKSLAEGVVAPVHNVRRKC